MNLSPALGNDCLADEEVKRPLLHDLFDLMGLPLYNTGLAIYSIQQRNTSDSDEDDKNDNQPKSRKSVLHAAGRWKRHRKSNSGGTNQRTKSGKSKTASNKNYIYNSYYSNQMVLPTKPRLWETITSSSSLNASWFQTRKGVWGNGKDWKNANVCEGGWSRLYPFVGGENYINDDGSVKKMVTQVSFLDLESI